jgi:DNA polymerase-3 subunit alpha
MEKQTIGMYLSGNPMEEYENKIKAITKNNIGTILSAVEKTEDGTYNVISGGINDGDFVKICAVISNRKNKTTKNNTQMAFLKLEDVYGSIEVLVFPKILLKFSDVLQEENIVMIEGRVSIREDEEPKLLMESATLLDLVNPEVSKKTIFIRLKEKNNEQVEKFKKIAEKFSGNTQVTLYFEDSKEYMKAPKNMSLKDDNDTISALKKEFGDGNVIIK